MHDTDLFFESILLMLLILLIIVVGQMIIEKINTLTIKFRLNSRKDFNQFDPDKELWKFSRKEIEKIEKTLLTKKRKKYVSLKWIYTTPSGRTTRERKKKYSKIEVLNHINLFLETKETGSANIKKLNNFYEEKLKNGIDLKDDFPKIYCYRINGFDSHRGLVKIGYAKTDAYKRISDQLKSPAHLDIDYEILFIMPAVTIFGENFMDHKVHKILTNSGVDRVKGEWFKCSQETARRAVTAAQNNLNEIEIY